MKAFNNIEILVLYSSNSGEEISLLDIVQQRDIMDIEHYEPDGFWSMCGGLQIIGDHYHTIFRSTNFHHLVQVTNFLIQSIYWINGKRFDWVDVDENYPDDVIIKTMSNQILRLKNHTETEVSLSFINSDPSQPRQRGEQYFADIVITKSGWCQAADTALGEYFEILEKVIQNKPTGSKSKIMRDYYLAWKDQSL